MPITEKFIEITFQVQTKRVFRLDARIVASNRARYLAGKANDEMDSFVAYQQTYDRELAIALADPSLLTEWLGNNMLWSDIEHDLTDRFTDDEYPDFAKMFGASQLEVVTEEYLAFLCGKVDYPITAKEFITCDVRIIELDQDTGYYIAQAIGPNDELQFMGHKVGSVSNAIFSLKRLIAERLERLQS